MKEINDTLLDSLTFKAKESNRKRAHFNLHPELSDPVQRLCIAMEPETYVRPHRHAAPDTWEVLVILRGSLAVNVFDERGTIVERTILDSRGPVKALELRRAVWHAPVSLEPGTIVFEIKQGPYTPIAEEHFAPWAPSEGESNAEKFLNWFKIAVPGANAPDR